MRTGLNLPEDCSIMRMQSVQSMRGKLNSNSNFRKQASRTSAGSPSRLIQSTASLYLPRLSRSSMWDKRAFFREHLKYSLDRLSPSPTGFPENKPFLFHIFQQPPHVARGTVQDLGQFLQTYLEGPVGLHLLKVQPQFEEVLDRIHEIPPEKIFVQTL